ncbi:YeiH family protein [Cupriavidus agavae]|uniref:Putative integral membrane protein (TIGR00698 family) n=1 Tax=Cupriavidus agavae TaxID=1001822 RepID=A0A4Q7S705_9BURK|nr:putative sulfate exporter family transporter [Cupriavidus agavae]RZT41657.1 putative integral membrane protein (TIGR00698 family) [Cupriavidus agavae]
MSTTPAPHVVSPHLAPSALALWRKRLLTVAPLGFIAWLAQVLADHPAISHTGLSALTLAMCAGMVAANTMPRHWLAPLAPGMQFARHHLLRLGVALYGLRLTFGAMAALGAGGVIVPLAMLVATLLFGTWAGSRFFGLSRREAILVSAGSAVCGAAAAIAVASVVRTDDRQTAVAVATVVLFGTAGMLLYPWIHELLTQHWHVAVSDRAFGIFTGATLHEVAQVIASGKMVSDATADAAVVAKMVRVLALGPLLLVMALWPNTSWSREAGGSRNLKGLLRSVPWFAVGFVAVMALNSAALVPSAWKPALIALDNWLLACAMLAIGLYTRLGDLLRAGRKPLALAGLLFVFLMAAGAVLCAWLV